MAIYSAVPPPPEFGGSIATNESQQPLHQPHPIPQQQQQGARPSANPIDIEAWTISALESLSVSPIVCGAGAPLSIPLDEHPAPKRTVNVEDPRENGNSITPPRRPPSRRDSMKRREALLKGKEGSRQRRRWDNDRLADVPNVQPPQPIDLLPRPTHPIQHVPYQIAAIWDLRMRAEVEAKKAVAARQKQQQTRTLGDDQVPGRVPRELFVRARKTPAMRVWVRSLEEPVRRFLVERRVAAEPESGSGGEDTEDEEIVFVGRNGTMRDGWKKARREGRGDESGMVFDSLGDDESGAFKRWLTHSISDYYGLISRSVLVKNPTRKVVYVGVKEMKTGHKPPVLSELPRPLWELC